MSGHRTQPPARLADCCRFDSNAEPIAHLYTTIEHYWLRGLRLTARRCVICAAFELSGHGGHPAFLENALEDALQIPSTPAYGSFEQPGSEHLRDRLPKRRRKRSRRIA